MAVHKNAIFGMKITHHQDIPDLVDFAMPVAGPRVGKLCISTLVSA